MGRRAAGRLGACGNSRYFGLAEADGEGFAAGVGGTGDIDTDGFAAGLIDTDGAAAPGATVAAGSGGLTLNSSTSKTSVAFGPMS